MGDASKTESLIVFGTIGKKHFRDRELRTASSLAGRSRSRSHACLGFVTPIDLSFAGQLSL
ncbi:MAG: hypothetical protein HKN60_10040 [Rhizobiales bacterium]|nr:hypothetical protein [Hyphomicrobiales bacterium]